MKDMYSFASAKYIAVHLNCEKLSLQWLGTSCFLEVTTPGPLYEVVHSASIPAEKIGAEEYFMYTRTCVLNSDCLLVHHLH